MNAVLSAATPYRPDPAAAHYISRAFPDRNAILLACIKSKECEGLSIARPLAAIENCKVEISN